MENLSNVKEVKYKILNNNIKVISCYSIGSLLFINFQIPFNAEINPTENIVEFENINIKTQNINFPLSSTSNDMANLIRFTINKNRISLYSNSSPNNSNKYGFGLINIIAVII